MHAASALVDGRAPEPDCGVKLVEIGPGLAISGLLSAYGLDSACAVSRGKRVAEV